MKHIVSRMSSYFPNRWPLSYLNLIKNMKTYIRRQDCLWYKLLTMGISGKMCHAVKSLYDNVKCAVKVNDVITPFLNVIRGVKQCSKLSPTLFAIYINDLAEEINSLNCGLEIGDDQLALLLYADDIVLLASTE